MASDERTTLEDDGGRVHHRPPAAQAQEEHAHLVATAAFFTRLRDAAVAANGLLPRDAWAGVHSAVREATRALDDFERRLLVGSDGDGDGDDVSPALAQVPLDHAARGGPAIGHVSHGVYAAVLGLALAGAPLESPWRFLVVPAHRHARATVLTIAPFDRSAPNPRPASAAQHAVLVPVAAQTRPLDF
ncbi:uncharacterized protein LOC62_01G001532 [Vanrija pseudolonga]|uniref:Uncharacterized protein n=1 Tax=Vanrija pseudolonga TaxID=143232 RepID=A0AAF0Y137_9TREE|nr:hypothetical protein LOC62_01G001532 [Vanrija pseudolonga]